MRRRITSVCSLIVFVLVPSSWAASVGSEPTPAKGVATTQGAADGQMDDKPPEAPGGQATAPEPFRLNDGLGLPDWLKIGIEQRTRYESVSDEFRAGRSGSNKLFALRTLVKATLQLDAFRLGAELIDSRQYGAPDNGFLNTTIVDAVELLQGYVGIGFDGVVQADDHLDLQIGRQTMDIGSRRLVARNRYRNTINAFTGIHAEWSGAADQTLRAFYVAPVRRRPSDGASLHDNDIQFDDELEETRFFGLHAAAPVWNGLEGEVYGFGLDEEDQAGVSTRDRMLWTLGGRLHKKPSAGEYHFEWESSYQLGDSRSSTSSSNTTDLDHSAQFHHLTVGYQFPGAKKLRLEGLVDYASGDDDPNDGDNNRFDTLFGARRWELGPTGILGAFARSNLFSPGYRVTFKPEKRTEVMLAHRLHFLASDRDAWTTSGLVDASGAASRELGQLVEIRVRYDVVPKNLRLEVGYAHLFAGDFLDEAPNATGQGDFDYVYLATILTF